MRPESLIFDSVLFCLCRIVFFVCICPYHFASSQKHFSNVEYRIYIRLVCILHSKTERHSPWRITCLRLLFRNLTNRFYLYSHRPQTLCCCCSGCVLTFCIHTILYCVSTKYKYLWALCRSARFAIVECVYLLGKWRLFRSFSLHT